MTFGTVDKANIFIFLGRHTQGHAVTYERRKSAGEAK